MAQVSPHKVVLDEAQRRELERRAAAYSGPYEPVNADLFADRA